MSSEAESYRLRAARFAHLDEVARRREGRSFTVVAPTTLGGRVRESVVGILEEMGWRRGNRLRGVGTPDSL